MIAIISDVHANLEALDAILDDIQTTDADEIYCLGDTVGYGPNPCECLDVLMNVQVFILGNHEEAVREEPVGFTPAAARAARWTKQQLLELQAEDDDPAGRFHFLTGLPATHEDGDFLYVHGSPRDPTSEYVYPHDARDTAKMWELFRKVRRCCFMGHTHIPGIFTDSFKFFSPKDLGGSYRLDGSKVLCNVGSVGQSRDGDWRASYVLFDGETIHFRRVKYDMAATVKKIKQIEELKSFLDQYKR